MITLTKRQRDILLHLLSMESFITYDQCAKLFSVSNRSIRKDFETIQDFLDENECILLKKPGVGIKIQCSEIQRSSLKKEMKLMKTHHLNRKERQHFAILMLLFKENCTFQEIADFCRVSKQTIINSFDEIQKELEKDELTIEKIQGIGLKIKGQENLIRRKFIDVITQINDPSLIHDAVLEIGEMKQLENRANEMIQKLQINCGITFVDPLRIQLIFMFVLLRNEQHHLLLHVVHEEMNQWMDHLDIILEVIKDYFENQNEQNYVASLLLGERMDLFTPLEHMNENDEAHQIAMYLIDALKQLNQSDFNQPEMIQGLTIHLRSAIYRYRNHIHIHNEMLDEIKISISLMYEFTRQKLQEIEADYQLVFDEHEIAYIAMYIASIYETSLKETNQLKIMIVCSFGLATSSMLKTRMVSILPNCEIIGPCSRNQALSYLQENDIDAVITTNEFEFGEIEVIHVNPLLLQRDIDKIKNCLFQLSYSKMCIHFIQSSQTQNILQNKKFIQDYVQASDIQIIEKIESWEAAIQLAAKPLLDKEIIFESYVESMIRAVKELGTYMVITPKVAYVHAGVDDGIQQNGSSILVLKNPIEFGDTNPKIVQCIVVLGIKDKKQNDLLNLAYILEKKRNLVLLEDENINLEQILNMHD